jgi:hypothetical protein
MELNEISSRECHLPLELPPEASEFVVVVAKHHKPKGKKMVCMQLNAKEVTYCE